MLAIIGGRPVQFAQLVQLYKKAAAQAGYDLTQLACLKQQIKILHFEKRMIQMKYFYLLNTLIFIKKFNRIVVVYCIRVPICLDVFFQELYANYIQFFLSVGRTGFFYGEICISLGFTSIGWLPNREAADDFF